MMFKISLAKRALNQLTVRLTLVSGRSSDAAAMNSFPYFAANKFLTCNKSGKSEHLGAENIMLATASRNSVGHSLFSEIQCNTVS